MRRIGLFLLFLMHLSGAAFAFHIAGGDLTAQHISGNTFRITLTLFRDCSNPQGADFDSTIILGIYSKNNDQLIDSLHMDLTTVNSVGLSGNGCEPPPNVCMQIGEYIRDVQLPPQTGGYYLVWERCCRNSSVINIDNPDATGLTFYLEIPNPALQNSSPVFNSPPTPYTCVQQLFQFHFDASDPDGDSLVYELTTPLNGGHTSNQQPNPFSPSGLNIAPDPAPYTNVIWSTPFSLTNITDGSIPVTINSQTGLMEGTADVVGIFAIAVVVYEYRNGVLIGQVRREIEFTVIPCNGNTPPAITSTVNSIALSVFASDTLCFTVNANDLEGDTLVMTHRGELFQNDPALSINPPYAQSQDTSGIANVAADFCWFTACEQGRDSAYIISYEAIDNGCPLPATQKTRIAITVNPPPLAPKQNLLCMRILNDDQLLINIAPDTSIPKKYFNYYTIYRSKNGDPMQAYRTIPIYNLQSFTDSAAIDNSQNIYCYSISITSRCERESGWSDTLCSSDAFNDNANYLRTVSVVNNSVIKVVWEDFPDGPFSIYHLYRRYATETTTSANEIAALTGYSAMEYTDAMVNVDSASYCYTLINEDVCGNLSPASNELCSILLQGSSRQYEHDLSWSEFENWKGGLDTYIVERRDALSNSAFTELMNTPAIVTADKDIPISGGVFAYRIKAIEGTGSYNEESLSNEVILQQQPYVWIPSAFTPNRDGINDGWGIETAFVESIDLSLFNRWGQKIWSTTDKTARWDGKLNDKEAQDGIYLYTVTYKGFNTEKTAQLSGRMTLIR